MQSMSKGVLEVKCRNVSKGVAAKETEADGVEAGDNGSGDGDNRDEDGDDDDEDVLVSGSSNVYWLQLYNADSGVLLRNMSNKASPHFNVSGIDPSTRVAAIVMTTNRQGRSEAVTLEGAVERAVGSRAGEKNAAYPPTSGTVAYPVQLRQINCKEVVAVDQIGPLTLSLLLIISLHGVVGFRQRLDGHHDRSRVLHTSSRTREYTTDPMTSSSAFTVFHVLLSIASQKA